MFSIRVRSRSTQRLLLLLVISFSSGYWKVLWIVNTKMGNILAQIAICIRLLATSDNYNQEVAQSMFGLQHWCTDVMLSWRYQGRRSLACKRQCSGRWCRVRGRSTGIHRGIITAILEQQGILWLIHASMNSRCQQFALHLGLFFFRGCQSLSKAVTTIFPLNLIIK
jgi:hypothetical protein